MEDRQPTPSTVPALAGVGRTSLEVLGAKVVASVALIATVVVTARVLGPAGRGALSLELMLVSFTMLVSGLGIPIAARVHLASTTNRIPFGEYLGLGVALLMVEGAVCSALGALLLPLAGVQIGPADATALALAGAAALASNVVVLAMYALGESTAAAMGEAVGMVAGAAITVAFAGLGLTRVPQLLLAMSCGHVLQVMFSLVRLARAGHAVRPRYSSAAWRRLARTGVPGIGLTLGQTATFRLDRYVVGLLLGPSAVGIYSVAATGPEGLRLVPMAVGEVLGYRVASGAVSPAEVRRIRRAVLAIIAAVGLVAFVAAPTAIRLVLGEPYLPAVEPFRVLLVGEVGITSFLLSESVLASRGRIPSAALVSAVGLVAVTVGDLLLIPGMGITGAAWASAAGYWLMAALAQGLRPLGGLGTPMRRPAGPSAPPDQE